MQTFQMNQFVFNKETQTLVAEASTLRIPAGQQLVGFQIHSPQTGNTATFSYHKTDTDPSGEDVAGWRYNSSDPIARGVRVLIIND